MRRRDTIRRSALECTFSGSRLINEKEVLEMRKKRCVALLTGGSLIAVAVVVSLLLLGKLYLAEKKIGYCFDVAVDADRLYVAAGDAGMHVLDISEGALRYVRAYHDREYYRNLKLLAGRAYVADTERGLVVLDITQDEPVTVWEQGSVKGKGIHVEGDKAYLAASWDGLYIFDITNPDAPELLGRCSARWRSRDPSFRGRAGAAGAAQGNAVDL
jgi:hypothetical protein